MVRRLVKFARWGTLRATLLAFVWVAAPGTLWCAGWVPRPYVSPFTRCDDEITDEEVIAAIKSVPMHYATPTLVQSLQTANSGNPPTSTTLTSGFNAPQIDVRMPNTCFSGNTLVVACFCSDGQTPNTPTDDGSNTWTAGATVTDATNLAVASLFYASNIASGTRHITITYSGWNSAAVVSTANGSALSVICSEWCNVGAIDGASGSHSNSTATASHTAGSITTTHNGSLVLSFHFLDSNTGTGHALTGATYGAGTGAGKWTAGTNFTLISADIVDTFSQGASQYWVQGTAGAINPTITTTNSCGDVCVGIALQAAVAGTAAPANSVLRVQWSNNYTTQGQTTMAFQFPCSGNLIVCLTSQNGWTGTWAGGSVTTATVSTPTPITDSKSNTWVVADSAASPSPSNAQSTICYAGNATTDTALTGTLTTSNEIHHSTLCFLDIQGAATSPLGNHTNASGTQTSSAPISTCTLTPSQLYSVCICTFSIAYGSGHGVNGVNSPDGDMLSQIPTMPQLCQVNGPIVGTGPNPLSDDQGNAFYYNLTTAAKTFTFHTTNDFVTNNTPSNGGVGPWSAAAAEIKFASPTPNTHPASITPVAVTFTGYNGLDCWFAWICPQGTATANWTVWGQPGAGFTESAGTNVGGGGGRGGDCATALMPASTPGNTYIFCCGSVNFSSQCVDDNLALTAAVNGSAATSATGASTTFGNQSSTAGPGGATHTGGSGATGTSSGGGGGGGGGGPTGNGGAGAVTGGGTAGTGSPAAGAGGAGGASGATHNGTGGTPPGGGGGGGFRASSGTGTGGGGASASQVQISSTQLMSQGCM